MTERSARTCHWAGFHRVELHLNGDSFPVLGGGYVGGVAQTAAETEHVGAVGCMK